MSWLSTPVHCNPHCQSDAIRLVANTRDVDCTTDFLKRNPYGFIVLTLFQAFPSFTDPPMAFREVAIEAHLRFVSALPWAVLSKPLASSGFFSRYSTSNSTCRYEGRVAELCGNKIRPLYS